MKHNYTCTNNNKSHLHLKLSEYVITQLLRGGIKMVDSNKEHKWEGVCPLG